MGDGHQWKGLCIVGEEGAVGGGSLRRGLITHLCRRCLAAVDWRQPLAGCHTAPTRPGYTSIRVLYDAPHAHLHTTALYFWHTLSPTVFSQPAAVRLQRPCNPLRDGGSLSPSL